MKNIKYCIYCSYKKVGRHEENRQWRIRYKSARFTFFRHLPGNMQKKCIAFFLEIQFWWLYWVNFKSLVYQENDLCLEKIMKNDIWEICLTTEFSLISCGPLLQLHCIKCMCFHCSPVLDQGALSGGAVCSSSDPWGKGLQHHHLGLVKETPAIVNPNMEPPLLDDNRS